MKYAVKQVENRLCDDLILNVHYAKRKPSISFAYGMFDGDELIGCCTFGSPASPSLQKGICGEEYRKQVIELNRLVLKYNRPNEASYLIGKSLKLLPRPKIVVSYADTSQNHEGIVYRATNFLYTGLSDKHCKWVVKGMKDNHCRHLFDKYGGINKAKEILGDKMVKKQRPRKHRYIKFLGSKVERKRMLKALRYKII